MRIPIAALVLVLFLPSCQEPAVGMTKGDVVWTTPECEFLVRFTDEPRKITRKVAGFDAYQAAELASGNAAFRADCSKIPAGLMERFNGDGNKALKALLAENAFSSGIAPIEIELEERDGVTIGVARGTKEVNGQSTTYNVAASIGDRTVLSAMIGSYSSEFPAAGQIEFLDSIESKR